MPCDAELARSTGGAAGGGWPAAVHDDARTLESGVAPACIFVGCFQPASHAPTSPRQKSQLDERRRLDSRLRLPPLQIATTAEHLLYRHG